MRRRPRHGHTVRACCSAAVPSCSAPSQRSLSLRSRPRIRPRTEAHASKRAHQRTGGILTGTDSDSDLDGNELLGVTLSPPIGALALRHGGGHTSVRSRSARRKALKRARRRHMTDKVAKSTPSPPPTAAAAPPPPVIGWPASDAVHARAQDAAKSGYALVAACICFVCSYPLTRDAGATAVIAAWTQPCRTCRTC